MENKVQGIDGDQSPTTISVPASTGENDDANSLSSHHGSTDRKYIHSLNFPAPVVTEQQDACSNGTKENVSGLARFEGMTRRRQKTRAETTMDNQTKLYKYDYAVRSSVMLLDREALDTRLTTKEGANPKRARSVDLAAFNELLQLSPNTANDKEPKIHGTARSNSEGIELEECAQGRNLPVGDQSSAEHDADDMSQGSSGNKRHTRNSSHSTDIPSADPLGGAGTTATLEDEIPDLADQIPIVVSCKRITRNTQQELAEEGSNAAESSEHLREEISVSAANAHDQNAATDSDDAPQKKKKKPKSSWAFGRARYSDPLKGSQPDYGPTAPYPPVIVQEDEEMPIPGGHKPVNRLGATSPNPVFKLPRPAQPGPKAFELKASARNSRREEENPAKRRRVEDPHLLRNGSSAAPIELLDESPQKSYGRPSSSRPPSSTKSGHSHGRNGLERNSSLGGDTVVREYRRVESTMKHKPRRRLGSSDGAATVIGGSQRFLRIAKTAEERAEMDLLDDPIISETEDELSHTDSSKKIHAPLTRKTIPQVEIRANPQTGKTTRYQGTANRIPSRQRENGSLVKPATYQTETGEISPHFNKGHSRGRNISISRSSKDQPAVNLSRAMQQTKGKEADDSCVDELAAGQFEVGEPEQIARELLALHNRNKRSSDGSKGKESHPASIKVDVSSDDDAQIRTNDIKPTNFGLDKAKSKKVSGEEAYQVSQLFSETHKWLLKDSKNSLVLEHHKKDELLTFYDQEKVVVQFPTKDVEKIEICDTSSKMVIHKSRTQTALGATKIYIEFGNVDLCQQLYDTLKGLDSTIGKILKTESVSSGVVNRLFHSSTHYRREHLDKVFQNVASKAKPPKRRRPSVEEEPDDIRLAKANSERVNARRWDKVQGSARTNTAAAGQRDENLERDMLRSKGVAKEMRHLSTSNDPVEVDGIPRALRDAGLHPDTFYRSSVTGPNGTLSHGTRSSGRVQESRNRSPVLRQSIRQRSQSPNPVRWTANNPGWEKSWQSSVVYPREGKNKASVDRQDIERLDEGEFLNDNLIIFYLRWLEDGLLQKDENLAKRIYFHNTFFYERLTKHGKGKTGGINYEAVERWTSKVDLLSYDYIVVPVNETVHWYVAIICNAPKLLEKSVEETKSSQSETKLEDVDDNQTRFETEGKSATSPEQSPNTGVPSAVDAEMEGMSLEEKANASLNNGLEHVHSHSSLKATPGVDVEKDRMDLDDPPPASVVSDLLPDMSESKAAKKIKRRSTPSLRKYDPNEPRIITMDSLGISHSPTCTNLKKYLMQEIKAKKNIEIDDPGSLGMTAKNIPRQNNHCDCGLFLLGYIKEFLKRPDEFVREILQRETPQTHVTINDATDSESDWVKASEMRNDIRRILFDLQKGQVKETEAMRKGKGESKRAAKIEGTTSASVSKSISREASRSARASPNPGKAHTPPESVVQSHPEKSGRRREPAMLDSSVIPEMRKATKFERPLESDTVRSRNNESTSDLYRKISLEENDDSAQQSPDLGPRQYNYITIEDSQEKDSPKSPTRELSNHVNGHREQLLDHDPSRRDHPQSSSSSRTRKGVEVPQKPEMQYFLPHPLPESSPPDTRRDQDPYLNSPTPEHEREQDNEWNGCEQADEVHLVDSEPRLQRRGARAVEDSRQGEDDAEMLFSHAVAQQPPADPPFLSSSPEFVSKPSTSISRRREGRKPMMSSPTSYGLSTSNEADLDAPSTRKRKTIIDLDTDGPSPKKEKPWQRDVSDSLVVGSRKNQQHQYFD